MASLDPTCRGSGFAQSPLVSLCSSVAVVATVCKPRDLSAGVAAAFVHQVEVESPSEEQRHAMLVGLSRDLHLGGDVNLERLAQLTAVRHPGRDPDQDRGRSDSYRRSIR